MTTILSNARLVLPDSIVDRGALVIDEAGGIADITTAPIDRTAGADWHDLSGHIVVPGFIDVHVHGVEGADTLATATAVGRHGQHVCRSTASPGSARRPSRARRPRCAASSMAVRAARTSNPPGEAARAWRASREQLHQPGLSGRAARGMPSTAARAMTADAPGGAFAGPGHPRRDCQRARRGRHHHGRAGARRRPRPGRRTRRRRSHRLARALRGDLRAGARGIQRGARHATHLFNRMPPFSHRAPGLVGAVIDSPSVRAEIVCDGYHVHAVVARTAIAALGAERTMAITDGTAGVRPADRDSVVPLGTHSITVATEACFLADGTLAGSRPDDGRGVQAAGVAVGTLAGGGRAAVCHDARPPSSAWRTVAASGRAAGRSGRPRPRSRGPSRHLFAAFRTSDEPGRGRARLRMGMHARSPLMRLPAPSRPRVVGAVDCRQRRLLDRARRRPIRRQGRQELCRERHGRR